uniref:Uncharacterized protein n=1 Tax=Ascaris lumbricoides TaxID=6252 RepID=A0A0M3IN20_ASCLU
MKCFCQKKNHFALILENRPLFKEIDADENEDSNKATISLLQFIKTSIVQLIFGQKFTRCKNTSSANLIILVQKILLSLTTRLLNFR